jgi:hypothetical protein
MAMLYRYTEKFSQAVAIGGQLGIDTRACGLSGRPLYRAMQAAGCAWDGSHWQLSEAASRRMAEAGQIADLLYQHAGGACIHRHSLFFLQSRASLIINQACAGLGLAPPAMIEQWGRLSDFPYCGYHAYFCQHLPAAALPASAVALQLSGYRLYRLA